MFLILQRLAVAMFTIFLFPEPQAQIILVLIIHSFIFLFNLIVKPYRNLGVDGIAFGTGAGLVSTCAFGIALSYKGSVDHAFVILILVLDLVLPFLATGVMMYIGAARERRRVAPAEVNEKGEVTVEETEKEKKKKPLDVVDIIINDFTLKLMSNFFIVVGVMAFIGFAIGIVGVLYSNSQLNVEAPNLSTVCELIL